MGRAGGGRGGISSKACGWCSLRQAGGWRQQQGRRDCEAGPSAWVACQEEALRGVLMYGRSFSRVTITWCSAICDSGLIHTHIYTHTFQHSNICACVRACEMCAHMHACLSPYACMCEAVRTCACAWWVGPLMCACCMCMHTTCMRGRHPYCGASLSSSSSSKDVQEYIPYPQSPHGQRPGI